MHKKWGENQSILPKKSILYLIKTIFQINTILILIGFDTFFRVKQSGFQNIKWFLSYTQKCTSVQTTDIWLFFSV